MERTSGRTGESYANHMQPVIKHHHLQAATSHHQIQADISRCLRPAHRRLSSGVPFGNVVTPEQDRRAHSKVGTPDAGTGRLALSRLSAAVISGPTRFPGGHVHPPKPESHLGRATLQRAPRLDRPGTSTQESHDVSEEPRQRPGLSCNLMGTGELYPERWQDAPVVQHDVRRDGANVHLLLERWRKGGHVADCFPPGLRTALGELRRLRALWAIRYAGETEYAEAFGVWLEESIRAEYAPPRRVARHFGLHWLRSQPRPRSKGEGMRKPEEAELPETTPALSGGATAQDLKRFRLALADAIDHSTLRAVARSVGMSPSGLTKFLDGTKPYGPTVERLREWYFRQAGMHQTPPEEIVGVLRRLVVTLPEPDCGVVNLLAAVDTSYQEAGMYTPEWVKAVRGLVMR